MCTFISLGFYESTEFILNAQLDMIICVFIFSKIATKTEKQKYLFNKQKDVAKKTKLFIVRSVVETKL